MTSKLLYKDFYNEKPNVFHFKHYDPKKPQYFNPIINKKYDFQNKPFVKTNEISNFQFKTTKTPLKLEPYDIKKGIQRLPSEIFYQFKNKPIASGYYRNDDIQNSVYGLKTKPFTPLRDYFGLGNKENSFTAEEQMIDNWRSEYGEPNALEAKKLGFLTDTNLEDYVEGEEVARDEVKKLMELKNSFKHEVDEKTLKEINSMINDIPNTTAILYEDIKDIEKDIKTDKYNEAEKEKYKIDKEGDEIKKIAIENKLKQKRGIKIQPIESVYENELAEKIIEKTEPKHVIKDFKEKKQEFKERKEKEKKEIENMNEEEIRTKKVIEEEKKKEKKEEDDDEEDDFNISDTEILKYSPDDDDNNTIVEDLDKELNETIGELEKMKTPEFQEYAKRFYDTYKQLSPQKQKEKLEELIIPLMKSNIKKINEIKDLDKRAEILALRKLFNKNSKATGLKTILNYAEKMKAP